MSESLKNDVMNAAKEARIAVTKYEPSCILCLECFMCGEPMKLTENEKIRIDFGRQIQPRICDKCRTTWIKMRDKVNKNKTI